MGDLSLYQTLGRKIGIMDQSILRKAAELKSLLGVRASSISIAALRLTETSHVVLCLDIAGRLLSRPVDKTEAVKLSGLKKTGYQVALKSLESVLDLNPKTSMRDMAVQFGCLQVLDKAASVLSRYEKEQCCDVDSNYTLFQAAALLCVCKQEKVRIDTSRLREMAGVRRGVMDRLVEQMGVVAIMMQKEGSQRKSGQKKKRTLMDDIEKAANGSPSEATEPKRAKTEKDIEYYKNVDFAEWKKKMLAKASVATNDCKA